MVNLGVVGCAAGTNAAPGCAERIEEFRLRAFMDTSLARARKTCEAFGGAYFTTSLEQLQDDKDLDAVLVCGPARSSAKATQALLAAGKHVFLQTPPALSYPQCADLVAVEQSASAKCMVSSRFRYSPLIQQLVEGVPEPEMVLTRMRLSSLSIPQPKPDVPMGLSSQFLLTTFPVVDLLYWLANSRPSRVIAFGGNTRLPREGDISHFVLTIEFENGAVASLASVNIPEEIAENRTHIEVYGNGVLAILANFQKLTFAGTRKGSMDAERSVETELDRELRVFRDCIVHNRAVPTPLREGVVATLVVLKALESLRSGEAETIDFDGLSG